MAPVFFKAEKDYIDQEEAKSMKQKLLEMVKFTVLIHTDEFIFVWSLKNGTKTSPRVPKLGTSTGGFQNLVPG